MRKRDIWIADLTVTEYFAEPIIVAGYRLYPILTESAFRYPGSGTQPKI